MAALQGSRVFHVTFRPYLGGNSPVICVCGNKVGTAEMLCAQRAFDRSLLVIPDFILLLACCICNHLRRLSFADAVQDCSEGEELFCDLSRGHHKGKNSIVVFKHSGHRLGCCNKVYSGNTVFRSLTSTKCTSYMIPAR